MNDKSFLLFYFLLYCEPARPTTPMIYSIQFLAFNFLDADLLVPTGTYHCENQPILGPACSQYSVWHFTHYKI